MGKPSEATDTGFTLSDFYRQVPAEWHDAELAIEDGLGNVKAVRQFKLVQDDQGGQIIVFSKLPIELRVES